MLVAERDWLMRELAARDAELKLLDIVARETDRRAAGAAGARPPCAPTVELSVDVTPSSRRAVLI